MLQKIPFAGAPPAEAEVEKSAPYEEADIFATIKANDAIEGVGDIFRPRPRGAGVFGEALFVGNRACPPYIPSAPPKLADAPRALRYPARKRFARLYGARQRRIPAGASFLGTWQLARAYLHYLAAGKIAGAWAEFGGLGAMLTNLANILEPSVGQNMETASRFGRAQNPAMAHLPRERGNPQLAGNELF